MVSPDGSLHQILAIAGEDLQVLILLDRHPETATVGASNAYGGNQKSVLHRPIQRFGSWPTSLALSHGNAGKEGFLCQPNYGSNPKPVNFNQDDDLQEDRYGRRLPLEKFLGLGFRTSQGLLHPVGPAGKKRKRRSAASRRLTRRDEVIVAS